MEAAVSPLVVRFTRTERLVHWVQAASFILLMATGFTISISPLLAMVGHRALLREIHLISAFFLVFGPALVSLAGDRKAVAADLDEVDGWSRDDVEWLRRPELHPTASTPPSGKFNAGQKLNAIFTLYATFAFGLTGLILWQNRRFPYSVVSQANTIHNLLAYLALAVLLGHIYLAVLHPATRHALRGMVLGTVRRDWAARHHPVWRAVSAPESSMRPAAMLRAGVLLAVGLETSLLAVRAFFIWLGANVTDPVTVLIYRLSALPGTLAHPATGVRSFDLAAILWAGLCVAAFLAARRPSGPPQRLQPALPSGHAGHGSDRR